MDDRLRRNARALRGVSQAEYLIILAVVSIAVLGAVTLFGRRIARLFSAATNSIDQGKPISASTQFPTTGDVTLVGGRPPTGNFAGPYAANDNTQYYESLLGDTRQGSTFFRNTGTAAAPVYTYTPPNFAQMPPAIALPANFGEQLDAAFGRSRPSGALPPGGFPLDTNSAGVNVGVGGPGAVFSSQLLEHGATLALDGQGNLILVNAGPGTGTSGFSPNTAVPAGTTYVGTVHTHPWEHDEHTAFSGPDADTMQGFKETFSMVVTTNGDTWMFARAADSYPGGATKLQVTTTYNNAYTAAANAIAAAEAGLPPAAQTPPEIVNQRATEAAIRSVAQTYQLGLYHGHSGEPLQRVVP